jgi:hypothetical protein
MNRAHPLLLVTLLVVPLLANGCYNQRILAPNVSPERKQGAEFQNDAYSWYIFFGLIKIASVDVPTLIAEVNPNHELIYSWQATSKQDWLASLVTIANLGILVSMSKVEVEGRFAGP